MTHEELLRYLTEFIAFRSIAENPEAKRQCLAWIDGTFLQKVKLPKHRGEINCAPYLILEHPDPKLIWFAHIDVVPASDELFTLRLEGDKAFGRGVKDMKGAALPFLLAYWDMCERGKKIPVTVLLTSDEEVGGKSILELLDQGILYGPIAFTPDTGANPAI